MSVTIVKGVFAELLRYTFSPTTRFKNKVIRKKQWPFSEIVGNDDFPFSPDVQTPNCLMQVSLRKKGRKKKEEKSGGRLRWGEACCHAGLLMDPGNYLQWSRLTLHMHAGLIGWNRRDTNQVNLVRGRSRPGWRSPEEWLEWAGAPHQETGRGLGITRIFHEEKINACPAPRGGLRQTSPRRAVSVHVQERI